MIPARLASIAVGPASVRHVDPLSALYGACRCVHFTRAVAPFNRSGPPMPPFLRSRRRLRSVRAPFLAYTLDVIGLYCSVMVNFLQPNLEDGMPSAGEVV